MSGLLQTIRKTVTKFSPRQLLLIWVAIYAACIACTLNNTYPIQGDESYYTVSAAGMVTSGSYMVPSYFGQPRFQKPVLTYWIIAASYRIFGTSLWSGRVPMLFAVLLLSASFLFISFSRIAMNEPVLIFLATCAMYVYARSDTSDRPHYGLLCCGWLCTALACMAKGPGPLVLPVSFAAYLAVRYKKHSLPKLLVLFHPAFILLFLLVTVPWYAYNFLHHHDAMLSILKKESGHATVSFNPLRYVSHAAFYTYIVILCLFPFTIMALLKKFRTRVQLPAGLVFPALFCAATLVVFIFFVREHKDRYLYSMVPSLAVMVGAVLYNSRHRLRYIILAAALSTTILTVYVIYPVFPGEALRTLVARWHNENGHSGTLASYDLDPIRKGWVLLLSGGKAAVDTPDADYVITSATGLQAMPDATIVARNDERTGLVFRDKKFRCTAKTFFLVQRSNR